MSRIQKEIYDKKWNSKHVTERGWSLTGRGMTEGIVKLCLVLLSFKYLLMCALVFYAIKFLDWFLGKKAQMSKVNLGLYSIAAFGMHFSCDLSDRVESRLAYVVAFDYSVKLYVEVCFDTLGVLWNCNVPSLRWI